ncbi:11215_t:CDS:2 [Acaulospora colombiana]|uniref:11215_t:CDS:1 n=1 Tax=Acaulospora colombiana TaxID=27376 RepID=A0ACA9LI41_9GLOM|nr:11215_t:CDS:2 [Acaulospora colombiana]
MNLSRILNPDTSSRHHNPHNCYINPNATTQVLIQLPLLELIFSFIKPSNFSALRSICLVNRLWCRAAIPYLWSSPFSSDINIDRLLDIMSIYVSCLDENSQISLLQLRTENVYAEPHPHNNMENLQIANRYTRILRLPPRPPPIFNYPQFTRSLNVYLLCKVINEWLRTTIVIMDLSGNSIYGNNDNRTNQIEMTRELFKHFVTRATRLTHIKFDSFAEYSFLHTIFLYFCTHQLSLDCVAALPHITTLDFDVFNISHDLLSEFSARCKNISSLYIRSCNFSKSTHGLSRLITSQRSIRHLHLENITVTQKVIASISFHVTTIESLTLVNVSVVDSSALWYLISHSRLKNLTIDFLFCHPETYDNLKPLWSLRFPEMRKFELIGKPCKNTEKSVMDNTRAFLELNGQSMRALDLDLNQKIYIKILPIVGERCTQLRNLTVRSYNSCDKSLGKMLKGANMKLEKLKVARKCYNRSKSDLLLENCELPPLRELKGTRWLRYLDLYMSLDADFVEQLLDGWEAPLDERQVAKALREKRGEKNRSDRFRVSVVWYEGVEIDNAYRVWILPLLQILTISVSGRAIIMIKE